MVAAVLVEWLVVHRYAEANYWQGIQPSTTPHYYSAAQFAQPKPKNP